MAKIVKNIEELVGRTPLFEFEKFEEKHDIKAHLLGKLEYFNPSGSIKDRAALNMIKKGRGRWYSSPGRYDRRKHLWKYRNWVGCIFCKPWLQADGIFGAGPVRRTPKDAACIWR